MEERTDDQGAQRIDFLKKTFLEYYKDHAKSLKPPSAMNQREFGFLLFREKIMVRHKAFKELTSFTEMLLSLTPSDVYYSTAYYKRPDLDMDRKGWLGSDLVFDVDADHIETPCKETHDMWICSNCKETRRGKKPAKCTKCGHEKIDEKAWLCDRCLFAAKEEMLKLRDFMIEDFGINHNEMHMFFSGHRGYHLHVTSESLRKLDDNQRKEIVDYLLALGLDPYEQGLYEGPSDIYADTKHSMIIGPQMTDPGWRGRLARGVFEVITKLNQDQLLALGFSKGAAAHVLRERETIERDWSEKILWSYFQDRWRITDEIWRNVLSQAVTLTALPARIDTVVTTDIHRLIRMPDTLNGKTGLRATMLGLDQLEEFDPFDQPIAFEGKQTVFVNEAPEIRIREQKFGPFNKDKIELPLSGAVLLIAKGVAVPVN